MDINNIIMYLRKSRADAENETVEETLAKHEHILQEYALKTFGHLIPEENIYKEVASGETISSRPQIKKVLSLVTNTNDYNAVLVVEPQRLSRGDMLDCGQLIRVLKYNNIQIITPQKTFNLSDQYDLKYFQMTLQQGNEYLEYVKFILNRGRIEAVKSGCFIGQHPPYGYDKIVVDKKHTLKPNAQADVIKLIFDLYVNQDLGCNQIASELDRRGIKPLINEYWSAASIRDMLKNPVYIGKIRWFNKKTEITTDENGNTFKTHPRTKSADDMIITDGLHEAIIDNDIFEKAQIKAGKTARVPSNREIVNPFATLIKCSTCGRSMTYRQYKNKDGSNRSMPRLLCVNQVHCHTPSVEYNEFLNSFIQSLKENLEGFKVQISGENNSAEIEKSILDSSRKELKSLEEQQNKLYDFLERGIYTEEVFLNRNKVLSERIAKLKKAISTQENTVPEKIKIEQRIYGINTALSMLKNPDVSAKEINDCLKSFIRQIDYYSELSGKGNRYIENKFSVKIDFL